MMKKGHTAMQRRELLRFAAAACMAIMAAPSTGLLFGGRSEAPGASREAITR